MKNCMELIVRDGTGTEPDWVEVVKEIAKKEL